MEPCPGPTSPSTFFQVNFTPVQAPGVSLSPYFTLDLRVERARDLQLNLTDTTDFTLQLVDANHGLSAPVHIAEYLDLRGPVGWANGTHRMLQTARIPLTNFAPIALESIRGLRLTFDQTVSGTIHVANIRATVADEESLSAVPLPSNIVPPSGGGRPASGVGASSPPRPVGLRPLHESHARTWPTASISKSWAIHRFRAWRSSPCSAAARSR